MRLPLRALFNSDSHQHDIARHSRRSHFGSSPRWQYHQTLAQNRCSIGSTGPHAKNMVTVELVKDFQAMQTLTHHTHHRLKLTRLFACTICRIRIEISTTYLINLLCKHVHGKAAPPGFFIPYCTGHQRSPKAFQSHLILEAHFTTLQVIKHENVS